MQEIALDKDRVNVVVAYTSIHRYIGKDGDLPWKRELKGDMKYITRLTRLHKNIAIIVGRVTYETIRRMKDVTTFVVTSSPLEAADVECFKTVTDAVEKAKEMGMYAIIFGGVGIYKEALRRYECKLFCTVVEEANFTGDRQFPVVEANLVNASEQIDRFLTDSGIERTWELRDGQFFENGHNYRFYIGDKIRCPTISELE